MLIASLNARVHERLAAVRDCRLTIVWIYRALKFR